MNKLNKLILITFLSSLLIVFINSLEISWYNKAIIFPSFIMLISYLSFLKEEKNLNKKAYYFLIFLILILISNFIVAIDFSNIFLNILMIPLLLSIFFMTLTNKNYSIDHCIQWFFKLFPNNLYSNLHYVLEGFPKNKNIKNILIGLLIGGPIGMIILFLLMSADDYFNAFIGKIMNLVQFDLNHIILFVISFILLFSVMINILLNRNTKLEKKERKNLNEVIVTTILTILNIILLLFFLSEISRITVNFLKIPVEYTYSSYAREGFFQLLIVTIIHFGIILYLLYRSNSMKGTKIKNLTLLLIAFSILLIFNSYYRMFLYIRHFGFTILRLQVILFLTMILLLFLYLIHRIQKGIQKKDFTIYFIIMISFYIINLYLCTTSFVSLLNH